MAAHLGTRSAAAAFATGGACSTHVRVRRHRWLTRPLAGCAGAAARASRPRQAAAAQCQPRHSPAGAPRQPRRLLSPAHSGAGRAGCSRRGGVAWASARDASQASAAIASAEPSGAQLLRDSRGDFVMTQPITVDKLVALLARGCAAARLYALAPSDAQRLRCWACPGAAWLPGSSQPAWRTR